jgi:hypothetical protein
MAVIKTSPEETRTIEGVEHEATSLRERSVVRNHPCP